MLSKKKGATNIVELCRRAEGLLEKSAGTTDSGGTVTDAHRLISALQVHRIELEMQIEQLCQSRDTLEIALKKYTDLYDFAPVGYASLDRNGSIRSVNLTGSSLMGIERTLLIGRRFLQYISSESHSDFSAFFGRIFTSLTKETCEVALRKGASILSVQIEGISEASGDECFIVLIDITRRKRMEAELHESEQHNITQRKLAEEALVARELKFRTLAESLPYNILRYDRECRVTYVNVMTLGCPESSLLGKTPPEFFENYQSIYENGFEETTNYQKTLQQVLSSGTSATMELIVSDSIGMPQTHSILFVAERDGAGAIIGALALGRDITECKQTEETLYKQVELETRLAKIAEISPGVIVSLHLTPDGWIRISDASSKLAELTGYRPEDVAEDAGMVFSNMHIDDIDPFIATICESADTLRPLRNEFRLMHPAKGEIWVEVDAVPVRLEVGGTLLYGFMHDTTERKRAEETIRQLNADLSATLQTIPAPMFEIDRNGTYLNAWAQNPELLARQKELLIGRTVAEMLAPDAADISMAAIREAMENGHSYGKVIRLDLDVGTRWFELSISRKVGADGPDARFIVLSRDITERKQAAETILAKQKKLTDMVVALSLAEERERRRIATELHDHIGQTLFLGKLKLGSLISEFPKPVKRDELEEIAKIQGQVMRSVRSLTQQLSPPVLSGVGLEAALAWLGKQIEDDYGLQVFFVDDRRPKPLGEDMRVIVYQACRELLINVVKHAETKSARFAVSRDGDMLCLSVSDQGVGFDLAAFEAGASFDGGFGLFNIRERLRHLGGELTLESAPGMGTRVTLLVALEVEKEIL